MMSIRQIYSLDVGTDRVRLVIPKKGLVYNEPNRLILNKASEIFSEMGRAAEKARASAQKQIVQPFKSGVIADFAGAKAMLAHVLSQSSSSFLVVKPDIIVTVSSNATQSEQKALLESLPTTKLHEIYPIPAIYAAALGAGLNVRDTAGSMLIHLGAGASEVAMFSVGEVIHESHLKLGGADIDDAIRQRVRRFASLELSADELFYLKTEFINLSPASPGNLVFRPSVRGRKRVTIHNEVLVAAIEPLLARIITATRTVIEASSPELVGDVSRDGILLTGGCAQMPGLDAYLTKQLRVSCVVADEPALCAVRGASYATTHLIDYLKNSPR